MQLLPTNWEWTHHDKHIWGELPGLPDLYLLPAPDAKIIISRPFTDVLAYEKITPSLENIVPFQHFISLDGSAESFLEFANKYGHLNGDNILLADNSEIWTSDLQHWKKQHWIFNLCYRLWQYLSSDIQEISKVLVIKHFEKDGRPTKVLILADSDQYNKTVETGEPVYVSDLYQFHKTSIFPRFQIVSSREERPIGISISVELNSKTAQLTPRDFGQRFLYWIINGQLKTYPTIAQLNYVNGDLKQSYRPENLLAAMWYSFFQVVTGERKIQQCVICDQWSDLTNVKKGKKPWDRHRECANWDAVNKNRKLATVKEMVKTGKDIQDIAQVINIETRHIKRWLEENE